MDVQNEKKKLRNELLNKLKTQSIKERNEKSKIIGNTLVSRRDFLDARAVMIYAALEYEVDTSGIIEYAFRCDKTVILPYVNRIKRVIIPYEIKNVAKETVVGSFGVREPNPGLCTPCLSDAIDVIIVPGVGFDLHGNRLGHGAGYYDTFLASLRPTVPKIGLAFDFQMVTSLPTEKHDIPLDAVMTNQ